MSNVLVVCVAWLTVQAVASTLVKGRSSHLRSSVNHSQRSSCSRPPSWCIHDGGQHYKLLDCDGDGIPDPYCYGNALTGGTGFISSRNGCTDNYPNGVCLKGTFEHVAEKNTWESSESISGHGSEMEATRTVRQCLSGWIQKYNVKHFMDAPCGDGNWQGSINGIDSILYGGFDIAQAAVKAAWQKNSNHPRMTFQRFDLTTGPPHGSPDLFMVRDVIQHLPLELGVAILQSVKKTGARWLAVSSWQGGANVNVNPGGMYFNDVHQPPFNLPAPVESCDNYFGYVQQKFDPYHQDHLELIDLRQWEPFR